jgi:hypothetical protein
MNGALWDRQVLLPRPGRTLGRVAIGLVVPAVLIAVAMARGGRPATTLFGALFIVAQVALALATAHKEMLAASFSYFQPGLRRRMGGAQLVWALACGAASAAVVGAAHGGLGPAGVATVFAVAVTVYAVFALLALHLFWAFQLSWFLFYTIFLLPWLDRAAAAGGMDAFLAQPLPWVGAAAVGLALLRWRVTAAAQHRRIYGAVVLGPDDIFRPGRVRELKELRSRHARPGQGPRWRARLVDASLVRAAVAARTGRDTAAVAWFQVYGSLAQALSRRTWVVVFMAFAVACFGLFGGYYDGSRAPQGDDLDRWFAGLAFQWATFPLIVVCMAANGVLPLLRSRRAGFRAELLVLAWATALSALLAAVTVGVFTLFESALPALPWRGGEVPFLAPRLHGLWLVPMLAPVLWLAAAVRPKPYSTMPTLVMTQAFLVGHAAMTMFPYAVAVPVAAVLAAVAGVVAFRLRRRWWAGGDHPV